MKRSDIELEADQGSFVLFKTTCGCSSPDHEITVCVEKLHPKDPAAFATLFFECGRFDGDGLFGRRLWRRVRDAAKILFTGELRIEEEFVFRDIGHIQSFQDALRSALEQAARAERDAAQEKAGAAAAPEEKGGAS